MSIALALSDDDFADEIVTWSGRIAAGEARLLELVAEFNARQAWGGSGLLSCAHWLTWRTGLAPGAAREKVRVARALRELPEVMAAFGAGRLSFSQVRAITRVATTEDQQRWIDCARWSTAAQLERLVRGIRRARSIEEAKADPQRAAFEMRTRTWYDDDGNLVITIKLPAEQGVIVTTALEGVRAELAAAAEVCVQAPGDLPAETVQDVSAETPSLADAMLEMARRTLGSQPSAGAKADLVAQVDPLSGWGRLRDGELLPPTSLVRVLRTLPGRDGTLRLRALTAADRRAHDAVRSRRDVPAPLRTMLGAIDGERCRFPGCTRHRTLHAHHVVYWSAGGSTDLDNLVLVCSRHHTLIHAQGFRLQLDPDRRLLVATADGVPIQPHPVLPWRCATELDASIGPDVLPPDLVDAHLDLRYAVSVLMQQAA
jgi:hypothetical protein